MAHRALGTVPGDPAAGPLPPWPSDVPVRVADIVTYAEVTICFEGLAVESPPVYQESRKEAEARRDKISFGIFEFLFNEHGMRGRCVALQNLNQYLDRFDLEG